ncbi:MAG: PhnD/SsuA/transferrin family substrate-binding protein [Desulforhopalus sp.]|jgi:twitching motility protein PilJ|nr:PhnD/SsuA/transferrin family substrate-binding protein [Desulforhopalus sp.]
MKKCRLLFVALVMTTLLTALPLWAAAPVKIGVLAKDGPAKALAGWKATADYLTATLADTSFEIIPLEFSAVNEAIDTGAVDFFLINSSMFIEAKVRFGSVPVATMVNSRQGKATNAFGGLIVTSADRADINSLNDLNGKTFMAVDDASFGGWQMAYKEILDAGIDPYQDFAKLEFGGKHENVLLAVQNGAVEAGTVRTDTLERLVAAGTVFLDDFKVLNQLQPADFPFLTSTALYPEWPLARVAATPVELADRVQAALLQLTADHPAAKAAKVVGWSAPLDYAPVEALQQTLKIGAYAQGS